MAEVRKRFSARSVLALNDSGDHPFGLPHIIDMESQVNGRGEYRSVSTPERHRSKSNESRQTEPSRLDTSHKRRDTPRKRSDTSYSRSDVSHKSSQNSSLSASMSSSWSLQNVAASSSSIKFPSIFSHTSPLPSLSEFRLSSGSSSKNPLPSMVIAYDVIIRSCVASYLELSFSVDSEVFRQANKVAEVFRVQRDFLLASTGHQDPEISLTGTGPEQAIKIREIKEMAKSQNNGSYPKHLSYISETIGILGWVVAGPSPNQFIRDAYNSGKHYADLVKVLQSDDRRRLNEKWISSWKWIVSELDTFVAKFHRNGLKWHKT